MKEPSSEFDITPAPKSAKTKAAAVTPTIDQELPTDFGEACKLYTLVDNITLPASATRAEQSAHRERLKRIAAHVYRMQQAPTAPVIGADEQVAQRAADLTKPDFSSKLKALRKFLKK